MQPKILGFKLDLGYGDRMGSLDFAPGKHVGQEAIHRYCGKRRLATASGLFMNLFPRHGPAAACLSAAYAAKSAKKSEEPAKEGPGSEYIYRPDEAKLLSDLLPRYISMCRFTAPCWILPQANMPRGWLRWITPPETATT